MNLTTATKPAQDKVFGDAPGRQVNFWDPIEPPSDPMFTLRHLCAVVEHCGVEGLAQCQSPNSFLEHVINLTANGGAADMSSGLSWNALRHRLPPAPRRDGRFGNWQVTRPSLMAAARHGHRAEWCSSAA
jgi:hypothetical protein